MARAAPASRAADDAPDLDEVEAWAVLASADRVGPAAFASLLARHGSARAVLRAASGSHGRRDDGDATATLERDPAVGDPLRQAAIAAAVTAAVETAPVLLRSIREAAVRLVTAADPLYPARLRTVELAPAVLYVSGDPQALQRAASVAVVGTRRPSDAGRRDAARIAGALATAGATVVSGLAVGIDGVAHSAALDESGVTVAVLGSGHLRLSPTAHRALARRIERSGGAIVSELPPLTEAARYTFPRRNRIISALADATVVVEAGPGSGALITAAWALEQGRDCFLVPGPLDRPTTMGSLRFLRDHHGLARLVVGVPELLAELGLEGDPVAAAVPTGELGPVERAIAGRLATASATLDQLVGATGATPATVLAALTRLELRGLAVDVFGRYRAAGRLATRGAPPTLQDASRSS